MIRKLMLRGVMCITLVFVFFEKAADAQEGTVSSLSIESNTMKVHFNDNGDIISINARYRSADGLQKMFTFINDDIFPLFRILLPQPILSDTDKADVWRQERIESDSSIIVRFSREGAVKSYRIDKHSYIIRLETTVVNDTISGDSEAGFILCGAFLPGHEFRLFTVNRRNGVAYYHPRKKHEVPIRHSWYGFRNRFWTALMRLEPAEAVEFSDTSIAVSVALKDVSTVRGTFYTGPVVYGELKKAGYECTKLLYPLWFWMRWLAAGLRLLFDLLLGAIGNTAAALVALSVCVKIIIYPLVRLAQKWQKQVNIQKSILQPRLDEINKAYRGELRNRKTLETYKELGIHPLYSLKSLLSAAIQIPLFFAAYHMLSEHIALEGVSFLWIDDLSVPDRLFRLPFSIPFFGRDFNMLPCIMTAVTLVSSRTHNDGTLTPVLLRKQRRSLYLIAALFFILLYPSPAGMVIYWTTNNILALLPALPWSACGMKRRGSNLKRSTI